jgi:hypothetical protein
MEDRGLKIVKRRTLQIQSSILNLLTSILGIHTGNPFSYHRDGKTVTLDEPVPAGFSPQSGQRYILTFAAP